MPKKDKKKSQFKEDANVCYIAINIDPVRLMFQQKATVQALMELTKQASKLGEVVGELNGRKFTFGGK